MGGKSIASRAANRRQRQKMNMSRYASSKIMIRPEHIGVEEVQIPEITTSEVTCKNCHFKARYKFLRCPECNAEKE